MDYHKIKERWSKRMPHVDGDIASKVYNSWRSIRFTEKGKKIGCSPEWYKFDDFARCMLPSYKMGNVICRKDKSLPFGPENCVWIEKRFLSPRMTTYLEYNGERKLLAELCLEHGVYFPAARQRYFKGKNYSPHEILFGKERKPKREMQDQAGLATSALRAKASKMMAQYRMKDIRRFGSCERQTIEWFIENILKAECVYCGSKANLGSERKDNSMGHTIDNIVPACYRCNTVRQNHFTHDQMRKIGTFLKNEIDV